jgi:hypothetical protein
MSEMKDYSNIVNFRRTTCPRCDRQMTNSDVKPPLLSQTHIFGTHDNNFYGGNVTRFCIAKCECGQELVLYLKNVSGGYGIHDVGANLPIEPLKGDYKLVDKEPAVIYSEDKTGQLDSPQTQSKVKLDVDLQVENTDILTQAIKDGETELAIQVMETMNPVQIPKCLVAAGIPELKCKKSGKILSKDAYKDLVEEYILKQQH